MSNFTLRDLEKRVHERAKASAHASYTRRLLDQGVAHCAKKLGEEAIETVLAASIFHFGEYSISEAKRYMARAGLPMRLDP